MTFKLPEGRTIRVLFHACEVQKTILALGCLAEQESDLPAGTGTLFLSYQDPDTAQPNTFAQG